MTLLPLLAWCSDRVYIARLCDPRLVSAGAHWWSWAWVPGFVLGKTAARQMGSGRRLGLWGSVKHDNTVQKIIAWGLYG